MTQHAIPPAVRRSRAGTAGLTMTVLALTGGLVAALTGTAVAATPVPLGTADSFVVLAGSGITNTGPTTLNGDLGSFPTTTITGTSTLTVNGTNHGGDGVTQQAKTDLTTAYINAAGQTPSTPIAGDLGGKTLVAGVYNSASSIGLTGALTLDGAGNPNAVFIFQAGSSLTTASGSSVVLINGAQPCNVFWQVDSSATIGTGSQFVGSILALTSITVTTGATIEGRALARNGAVSLASNTISRPSCAAAVAAPAATPTATPTATPGATAGPTAPPSALPSAAPTATDSAVPLTVGPSAPLLPPSTGSNGTQVAVVPQGPVRTGDGSSLPQPTSPAPLVGGGLGLLALGGLGIALRRRTRHS